MKILRVMAVLLLAVVAFHAIGMEVAYCNDGGQSDSCLACSHDHFATEVITPTVVGRFFNTEMPILNQNLFFPPAPTRNFFRPPISF